MTLEQIVLFIAHEASVREREAINLFVDARNGKNIDGKRIGVLDSEARKLRKVAHALDLK